MDATPDADLHIRPDVLLAYVRAIWASAGSSPREADLVADHLVAANLSGHDSHGISVIPRYVASLADGELQLNGHAEIVADAGAVLTLDGRQAFGQVVGYEAMEYGIERARSAGVCALAVRSTHHLGRIGHWAEQCANAGFVSFHFVSVVGGPLVAPFGGIDRRFGTNPFCAAYPRPGEPPLVLDFATSSIAYGKTLVAYNRGVHVGPGHLIDHTGAPTTDPSVMHEPPPGALLPFGAHKGYGLAVMCEILAGALSGGRTTRDSTRVASHAMINCMLTVILDPNAFDAPAAAAEADAFLEWVKGSPLAAGTERIYVPGEPENARRAERTANGVPVDPTTWRRLREAALAVGTPVAEVDRFARQAM
jgi:hydroxycarboxylate dehydrogenase B